MGKQYRCACGFITKGTGKAGLREFRQHLYQFSAKEKGKHWKVTEARVLAQVSERLGASISTSVPVLAASRQVAPKAEEPRPKYTVSLGKWLLILGGLLLVLAGGAAMYYGNSQHQAIIIIAGFILFASGAYLTIRGLRAEGGSMVAGKGNVPADNVIVRPKGTENCLNIYAPQPDVGFLGLIDFTHAENPVGIPWKCENDGQWYYVNLCDGLPILKTSPLTLPNTQFYDPKEFANIVGAEPIKRFFEMHFQTLEKLAPWLFIAMCVIFLLAMIMLPGVLKGG